MDSHTGRTALPLAIAVFVVLGMGVAYTALDMAQPAQPWQALLACLPSTLSVLALGAAGCARAELYLRLAPLSRPGVVVLAAVFVLLLPILGSSTGWTGWEWLPALIYAPASGIAQELYFRASLLPALEKALVGRKAAALLVQGGALRLFSPAHFCLATVAAGGPCRRQRAVAGGLWLGLTGAERSHGGLGDATAQPLLVPDVDVCLAGAGMKESGAE